MKPPKSRGRQVHKNISIRGVVYPDANAAAKALGLSASWVRTCARLGQLDRLGHRGKSRAVTIRGVTYPSFAAAATALGVTPTTVRKAFDKGTLHRVGTGRVGVEPMPVQIAGQTFEDARAAASHFGVQRSSVYAAINDGDPDRIARKPRYNPARAQPFRIGTLTFPSMRAASVALGFKNPEFINKAMKKGSKRGRERIVAAAMAYADERQASP